MTVEINVTEEILGEARRLRWEASANPYKGPPHSQRCPLALAGAAAFNTVCEVLRVDGVCYQLNAFGVRGGTFRLPHAANELARAWDNRGKVCPLRFTLEEENDMRVRIDVTDNDIHRAKEMRDLWLRGLVGPVDQSRSCPIALAARRALQGIAHSVVVSSGEIRWGASPVPDNVAALPPEAAVFVWLWDVYANVSPVSFDIEVEETS